VSSGVCGSMSLELKSREHDHLKAAHQDLEVAIDYMEERFQDKSWNKRGLIFNPNFVLPMSSFHLNYMDTSFLHFIFALFCDMQVFHMGRCEEYYSLHASNQLPTIVPSPLFLYCSHSSI
jgi:hypothetical protein